MVFHVAHGSDSRSQLAIVMVQGDIPLRRKSFARVSGATISKREKIPARLSTASSQCLADHGLPRLLGRPSLDG